MATERERLLTNMLKLLDAQVAYLGPDLRYRYANATYERLFGISGEENALAEALASSQGNFRDLISRSPDGILIHVDGTIVTANDALVNMLGYEGSGNLVGQNLSTIIPEPIRERIRAVHERAHRGSGSDITEGALMARDGTPVPVEAVAIPVEVGGEPALLTIARDVSERRRMTAKVMEMDRMAALGTLAAGVGHEVNNPLTYIWSNLQYVNDNLGRIAATIEAGGMERSSVSQELAELHVSIRDAIGGAIRVRDVVQDLKSLSQPQADTAIAVALEEVLASAVRMTGNELRHRAQLVEAYEDAPFVMGHESRLAQVFVNVLINAAQAISPGRADDNRVTVGLFERDGHAVIEVTDTGEGIEPDAVPQIFDPFYTTKDPGQGTGLGLSTSRQIIGQHHGTIEVNSRRGEGTTVRIAIPTTNAAVEVAAEPRPVTGRSGRLLVIDDEIEIGRAFEKMLGAEHVVVAETSAQAALGRLKVGEDYDLIFRDLMMPNITGMEFLDLIRSNHPQTAEHVVFLTGGTFTKAASDFLKSTDNDCLEKPLIPAQLRAWVAERLDRPA